MKSFYLILCLIILGLTIIQNRSYSQVQSVKDAWKEYNSAKDAFTNSKNSVATTSFRKAIQYATQCIIDFEAQALVTQDSLAKKNVPCNDCMGSVSPTDRQRCFGRWALNDVATAYFIKGKSVQYLRQINSKTPQGDLVSARNGVMQLYYGRCWDIQGWFWSPCESLNGKCCTNR